MTSPFERDLGAYKALPSAFRDQYLLADGDVARLEGAMERVWRRGRWLWPLFWLASWFDLLFPETGRDVPVTVVIRSVRSRAPSQSWRREFRFPRGRRRFASRMEYDARLGRVVEAIGPLAIAWDVRFEAPSRLALDGAGWVLRLGAWRVQLPAWMLGTGRAVETAEGDTIRIDLSISHPLLGDVFGYVGEFRVHRLTAAGE